MVVFIIAGKLIIFGSPREARTANEGEFIYSPLVCDNMLGMGEE